MLVLEKVLVVLSRRSSAPWCSRARGSSTGNDELQGNCGEAGLTTNSGSDASITGGIGSAKASGVRDLAALSRGVPGFPVGSGATDGIPLKPLQTGPARPLSLLRGTITEEPRLAEYAPDWITSMSLDVGANQQPPGTQIDQLGLLGPDQGVREGFKGCLLDAGVTAREFIQPTFVDALLQKH